MPDLKVVSIFNPDGRKPNKFTHSKPDIVVVTQKSIDLWKEPPFQRPMKLNPALFHYRDLLKQEGGVFPGTPIQLGIWEKETYLVDGRHRREAFKQSGLEEGICNVVYTEYVDGPEGLAQMAKDFLGYQTWINRMTPDDAMRGIMQWSEPLQIITRRCPFVGFCMVRRSPKAPLLSMAATLRAWFCSALESPSYGGLSAAKLATELTVEEANLMCDFLKLVHDAWGDDLEYSRLWGNLNLTLCMWLYRRLVITPYSMKTQKITKEMFTKLLMSLTADRHYYDWLLGHVLRERDRSPCYQRIKAIFAARLLAETGHKPKLPQPSWSVSR